MTLLDSYLAVVVNITGAPGFAAVISPSRTTGTPPTIT
jgi:hypothetical protein